MPALWQNMLLTVDSVPSTDDSDGLAHSREVGGWSGYGNWPDICGGYDGICAEFHQSEVVVVVYFCLWLITAVR